jgi:hypothetical protein
MNFVFEDINNYRNFVSCDDVNQSGFRRFTVSPMISGLARYSDTQRFFSNFDVSKIKKFNSPFMAHKYIIPTGVAHCPEEWCGDNPLTFLGSSGSSRKSLFAYLNPVYLRDLKSGKAFLLLDQSHEGYHADWLHGWFHANCTLYGINPTQIIYVTGNMAARDQYNQWCTEKNIKDKMAIIPHPEFEAVVYETALNRFRIHRLPPLPNATDHIEYKSNNLDKIKLYNCLQKRPRVHRIWLFKELYFRGLIDDGINSMNQLLHPHTYYENKVMDINEYEQISKLLPMLPPHTGDSGKELTDFESEDSGKYQLEFNDKIALDSWLTVISEASFAENTCFISEKTFKFIADSHPFIIAGNKNSLKYLKDLGYKTFSPWIDESYDELDTWERYTAIGAALEKIKQLTPMEKLEWFKGMRDILDHNLNVLRKNTVDVVPQSYIEIREHFERIG